MSKLLSDIFILLYFCLISQMFTLRPAGIDIQNLLDIRQTVNTEVAMRLTTNIENQDVFYTDLNGYQVQYLRM